MNCDACREAISAALDGESTPAEESRVADHLQSCTRCVAFRGEATAMHRTMRVRLAEPVPDLATAIVEAVGQRRPTAATSHWSRFALGAIAGTELILAVPIALLAFGADPAAIHPARELGAADLAVAIGFLVAAVQPWRASALVPVAVALGATISLSSLVDLVGGDTGSAAEAHHVLELAGIAVLVVLARQARPRPSPRTLAPA